MVNHVKRSALNSRFFKLLCEDLNADHSVAYFYFIQARNEREQGVYNAE